MPATIALFASGSGSNAENIIRYFAGNPHFSFPLIISNKSDAYVHERAKKLRIPSFTFSKADFDNALPILAKLAEYHVTHIVLAGFLLKVSDKIVETYPDKIINIHPALLPLYGGKGMYGDRVHRAVCAAGEAESGITIHYVNSHYDEGGIIFQAKCSLTPDDTPETVAEKVHALEYTFFPEVIADIWT